MPFLIELIRTYDFCSVETRNLIYSLWNVQAIVLYLKKQLHVDYNHSSPAYQWMIVSILITVRFSIIMTYTILLCSPKSFHQLFIIQWRRGCTASISNIYAPLHSTFISFKIYFTLPIQGVIIVRILPLMRVCWSPVNRRKVKNFRLHIVYLVFVICCVSSLNINAKTF